MVDIRKEIRGTISVITEDRVAVEITLFNEVSLGVLYFERPKQGWVNKPIMPTKWRCVDANIEGLKVHLAEDNESAKGGVKISVNEITPKQLVEWAQTLVEEYFKSKVKKEGEDNNDKKNPDDNEGYDIIPNLKGPLNGTP